MKKYILFIGVLIFFYSLFEMQSSMLKDEFNSNRTQILKRIKGYIDNEEFTKAKDTLNYFKPIKDKRLDELYIEAETKRIEKRLKTIPVSYYELNKILYKELLDMHPENKKYKQKFTYYTVKYEANKVITDKFLYAGGPHIALERYLKSTMNDPSSYEHVSTYYTFDGKYLNVITRIRGSNLFGAKIINSYKAIITLNDQIISLKKI